MSHKSSSLADSSIASFTISLSRSIEAGCQLIMVAMDLSRKINTGILGRCGDRIKIRMTERLGMAAKNLRHIAKKLVKVCRAKTW